MTKPSKKQKTDKPAEEPKNVDPEQHATTETLHQVSEAVIDDPPPEDQPVTQDAMDADPENDKPPSPAQPAHESDDIMITGTAYQAPGNPIALSKHSAKEEFSAVDKGKWKVKAMLNLVLKRFTLVTWTAFTPAVTLKPAWLTSWRSALR